jgi:alkaline phosphatase
MLKRTLAAITLAALIPAGLAFAQVPATVKPVKNIIIMIPDGMSVGGTTLTRWVNGVTPLAMDELAVGLMRTYPSDAIVNDSAPAGTALACGITAQTGNVGVYPDALTMPGLTQPKPDGVNNLTPAANIMEAARLQGRATGLVATSEIQHATPAAFSAHDPSRKNYDNIGEQQVYAGFDVVLGGGQKYYGADVRKDKEDLLALIKASYEVVTDTASLMASKAKKIWGFFGMNGSTDLGYDLDRDPAAIPSLAEMTEKAISTLAQNPKGFVLMVEGSLVDWAAHANETVGIVGDINAFDKAVAVAKEFAKKDKNTVVIVVSDHGNSGITIGNTDTTNGYDTTKLATVVDPIKKATKTAQGTADLINAERSNIKEVVKQYYGVELSDEEVAKITAVKAGDQAALRSAVIAAAAPKLAKAAKIGYTTGGHTGEDVVFHAYNPNGERPTGVIFNTDVARYMEKLIGADLVKLTKQQFQDAAVAFALKGASVKYDYKDPTGNKMIVTKGKDTVEFFQNKNIAKVNGKETKLSGLVVLSGIVGGENWFVPADAVALIK